MNRSFSSSFRANTSHKSKKMLKSQEPPVGFQTLFKSRNGHGILKNIGPNLIKKSKSSQQVNVQVRHKIQNAQPMDQDIKKQAKDIKNEKKNEEKKSKQILYQSLQQDRQPRCQVEEMPKSYSQPKLGKKKTFFQKVEPCSIVSNLQQLQKKVSEILQLKLIKKSQSRNLYSFRPDYDELEKDLQILIEQIQVYRTEKPDDESNMDLQIRQLGRKINIIQNIIAQSYTESEMLKKYYFLKKIGKKSFNILESKLFKLSKAPEIKSMSYNSQFPSMHFSTIAQTSFVKFDKEAYIRQNKNNNNYTPSKHPLTRSSYQTHFLSYGSLPTYPQKSKTEVSTFNLSQNKSSVYQNDFKPKKVQLIDSKQLDCRRDKFKPTEITYMPKKMLGLKQNQNDETAYKNKTKNKKKINKQTFIFQSSKNFGPSQSYSRFYKNHSQLRYSQFPSSWMKSEYNTNYEGEKAIIECLAKQTNLSNLKYEFRRNFNA